MSLPRRQRAGRSHPGAGCVPRPRRVGRASTGAARSVRLSRSPARCRRGRRACCVLKWSQSGAPLVREKSASCAKYNSLPMTASLHSARSGEAASTEFGGGRKRAAAAAAASTGRWGQPHPLAKRTYVKSLPRVRIPLSPQLPPRCTTKRGVGSRSASRAGSSRVGSAPGPRRRRRARVAPALA